jgi:hypothetical protein
MYLHFHISCILLLRYAAQKMKSYSIKTFARHVGPGHPPMAWCLIPMSRPLGLVICFGNKTRCNKH